MTLYRYYYLTSDFSDKICLEEFKVIKETPQGFWIDLGPGLKRWVPKYGKNLYAFVDKDKALFNFKKRKQKQLKILKAHAHTIERVLSQINKM